jgi:hypothetical protein
MQMEHALSGVGALIDHQSVSAFGEAQLLGHIARREQHLPQRQGVGGSRVVDTDDVLFGDDQRVRRRHGPNVCERDDVVVLEHDPSRGRSRRDVAKETGRHVGPMVSSAGSSDYTTPRALVASPRYVGGHVRPHGTDGDG